MDATTLGSDIAALETALESPSSPAAASLGHALSERLRAVSPADPRDLRELAVRGLLAASQQAYRTGGVATAGDLLRAAIAISDGIDAALRIAALLRCGEAELLDYDVGSALVRTAEAMDIARAAGRPADEARAWVAYGMALDWAGLYQQADERWAHALRVTGETGDARLQGNIWALRCPLGFRLRHGQEEAAEDACRQALRFALASPARYRDSMACTALCNWAALDLQRGRVAQALARLDEADSYRNLGVRPRWLVEVLRAMADVRSRNDEASRGALDRLLRPERAPAAAYVIETYAVMAAMYADMGDPVHASETLEKLSRERARALWAMLRAPLPEGSRLGAPAGEPPRPGGTDGTTALLVRLAVTAELRDDATGKHCFRVGRLAMLLGRRAGVTDEALAGLDLAARLHDIGKLVIPDAILLKPGRLDATETHLMRSHTVIGAEILAASSLPVVEAARAIARHHHERWDGKGYPDGLAGEAIPLAARVAALADVYDALTHERPYKRAWSHDEAIAWIADARGTQFDPRLTDHFLALMAEASADFGAFLADLEKTAGESAYVRAQARVNRVLGEAGAG